MKKWMVILMCLLLCITATACVYAPAEELSEEVLVTMAKARLGVPYDATITYEIGKVYRLDTAERDCRNITFYESDVIVAGAAMDVVTGEAVRDVLEYEALKPDVQSVFMQVLCNERSFSYTCMVYGETTQEYLDKFGFSTLYSAKNAFVPQSYVLTDWDSDGVEDLLVLDARLQFILFLRYDGVQVYGTILENFNLQELSVDWITIV